MGDKKKRNSGFGILVNIIGMVLLVVMFTYVGVNFVRDARAFEKPLLTSDTNKKSVPVKNNTDNNATVDDNYGTIKYKKPASDSSDISEKSSSSNKKSTSKSKKKTAPERTPEP